MPFVAENAKFRRRNEEQHSGTRIVSKGKHPSFIGFNDKLKSVVRSNLWQNMSFRG